jgi:phosphoserine phosphatase
MLSPSRIILLGEVDGVFDADPHKEPNARLIPEISNENIKETTEKLGKAYGFDVTGGMLTKITEMYNLVRIMPSIEVRILSGSKEGLVRDALLGKDGPGTVIRYKGESPIPKVLVTEINGVIVKEAIKPWLVMLKKLYERGYIASEIMDGEVMPIVEKYFTRKIDRDEAVKLVAMGCAKALKGKKYSDVMEIAKEALGEVRKHYDPYMLKLLKYAKERKYTVIAISSNFYEMAKLIAEDIGADKIYDAGLKVENGIITGETHGEFMTSAGKVWAVRDIIQNSGTVKERVMYIGNRISDWKAMRESGIAILYRPELSNEEDMTLEEKQWVEDVLMLIRTNELPNLIVISGKPETARLKELIK